MISIYVAAAFWLFCALLSNFIAHRINGIKTRVELWTQISDAEHQEINHVFSFSEAGREGGLKISMAF